MCLLLVVFSARIWRADLMKEYSGSQETLLDPCSFVVSGRFLPEFGSFVLLAEAIAKMSELRLKGVRRSDLKIIASDPDLAAITKDVEALNDA